MNTSSMVLSHVPARLQTMVMGTRSVLGFLGTDEIVKPPMSMIVGGKMLEKTYSRGIL